MLSYHEEGRGPVVLLVHAFPLNHAMWEPQIAALKNQFRVIAPDVRGFGKTAADGAWSIADAADDLEELLASLGVAECSLVGLSMGGYIALPFYAKYPARVRRLVLADTRARADNDAEKSARTDMIAALQQSGAAILPERMLPRLLKPEAEPAVAGKVRLLIEDTSAGAAIYALMAMRDRPDVSTVLHRISCPTLVLAGAHDAITRIDECRDMAATVSSARFAIIPDAGHLSNLENPAAFNRKLAGFLQ